MKNVVVIGGGTGTSTLLYGLKKYPVRLSVIVPSWDDGGSNGRLRTELNAFPFSDARQCLVALSEGSATIKELFSYRFCEGTLAGHTAANLVLAALEKITGGSGQAIAAAEHLLRTRGEVLPVTLKPTVLSATYQDGRKVTGEHNIDEPGKSSKNKVLSIRGLQLSPKYKANPKAVKAVRQADVIIFGPGDLYTSILPNLLVKGVKEAVAGSKARKIFITNLMTKHGQTDGFKASDLIRVFSEYLGKDRIDTVVINDQKPSAEWLKRYHKEKGEFVWPDVSNIRTKKLLVLADNFLADYVFYNRPGDKLKRSLLRHNSEKLAKIVWRSIN